MLLVGRVMDHVQRGMRGVVLPLEYMFQVFLGDRGMSRFSDKIDFVVMAMGV